MDEQSSVGRGRMYDRVRYDKAEQSSVGRIVGLGRMDEQFSVGRGRMIG